MAKGNNNANNNKQVSPTPRGKNINIWNCHTDFFKSGHVCHASNSLSFSNSVYFSLAQGLVCVISSDPCTFSSWNTLGLHSLSFDLIICLRISHLLHPPILIYILNSGPLYCMYLFHAFLSASCSLCSLSCLLP